MVSTSNIGLDFLSQETHARSILRSSELHYIDAQDDPLHGECNVVDARDCGDHCILTGKLRFFNACEVRLLTTALAITNYTARVQDYTLGGKGKKHFDRYGFLTHSNSYLVIQQDQALRFLSTLKYIVAGFNITLSHICIS